MIMPAYLNESEIELVDVCLFSPQCCLIRRDLDGNTNNKVSDTWLAVSIGNK